VVVGDPESTVPDVVKDFQRGTLAQVYRGGAYAEHAIPTPRFDLIADQSRHALCFEATRGCPFRCEFCVLTGLGTRHHTRSIESVLLDVTRGQEVLRGRVPAHHLKLIGFCDNNIGGNIGYLRQLCAALEPLRLQWYGAASFNIISNPDLVAQLARSGCRALFVGLESFNPIAIADMNKHQNAIPKMRAALESCRDNGILVISGLMLSPLMDDLTYLKAIPRYLRESGLHVPTFICFEAPIPGTPHFHRLARRETSPFLANALLRDFTGYTLVLEPSHAEVREFVNAYRALLKTVYSPANRAAKLIDDLPRFLKRRLWLPALVDIVDMVMLNPAPRAGRSLTAGDDTPPPERVPFVAGDFESEAERRLIMDPWRVTDESGRVLDCWLESTRVYGKAPSRTPRLRKAASSASA
jgi:radical SAM superfamily enzyme YgiQ (UPF0313 family)